MLCIWGLDDTRAVPSVVDAGPLTKMTCFSAMLMEELDPSYGLSFCFDPLFSLDHGSQLALQPLDELLVVMEDQSRWLL